MKLSGITSYPIAATSTGVKSSKPLHMENIQILPQFDSVFVYELEH